MRPEGAKEGEGPWKAGRKPPLKGQNVENEVMDADSPRVMIPEGAGIPEGMILISVSLALKVEARRQKRQQ